MVVSFLPKDAKKTEIAKLFSTVGKVEQIKLVFCPRTHQFRNEAYIEFANRESVLLVSLELTT